MTPAIAPRDDAELLGKLLRIDVDARTGTKQYGIPSDNPFASSPNGAADPRPEIWGKGLRNPFRFGFDTGTGDLYIADVGQGAWEEVNAGPNVAGMNWGWDDREGRHCYEPMTGCLTAGRTEPVTEHSHNSGWISVIGGVVYRGTHLRFDHPIAVKCLKIPSHFTADAKAIFLQRFKEEGKILHKLGDAPGVPRVYDYGVHTVGKQEVPFLVMEWLAGQTLEVIFGVAWAWLGAGESPTQAVLGGGMLVLAALAGNEALAMRGR